MSGESGISFAKGNIFKNEEDYANHIEEVHDMPVRRKGETKEECQQRFKAKNKRAGTENCRCPACLGKEADLALMDLFTTPKIQAKKKWQEWD